MFLSHYFREQISEKTAYEEIAKLRPSAQWAEDLRLLRHDILHYRSAWLRFEVNSSTPRFDPVLVLDWRPGATGPDAEVKMFALRQSRTDIVHATSILVDKLIADVAAWP